MSLVTLVVAGVVAIPSAGPASDPAAVDRSPCGFAEGSWRSSLAPVVTPPGVPASPASPAAPVVTAPGEPTAHARPAARSPVAIPSTHGPCTELDLDGDGVLDRVDAVPDTCGTGGCVYRVSLVRPGADRFVGELEGQCSFELASRHRGLADVVARWHLGARETAVTRYRFDGHRYRELASHVETAR